ncbi:MAG: hypothetical protein IJA62_01425 [Ruminococcus sp.]|nr:hypothetical protein [Ruminococcus sp.]
MRLRFIFTLLSLILVGIPSLNGCFAFLEDEVVVSLGEYTHKEFYTSGGFQDYTDYAKYHYDDVDLKDNPYLKQVNDENISEFIDFLENFESWVYIHAESEPEGELAVSYDFNTDIISEDDYVYMDNRYDGDDELFEFSNYNLYFFDSQSKILYFFHNNI